MMEKEIKSTVLVTGATGLIGEALLTKLHSSGYNIRILSRRKRNIPYAHSYLWDIKSGSIEEGALRGVDHIIHLAGENIGSGRWTASRKKAIINSRILSTRLLFDATEKTNTDLKSFTSASATGYYGSITSENIFTETDPPGSDFAAKVCIDWEKSASLFRSGGYRTSIIRTGIVLSEKAGMLARVLPTINMRFSPLFGSGYHYLPWIHIDDICGIYLHILENSSLDGIFNGVSPLPVNYKDFIKTLSRVKRKKVLMPPTPEFPWKILFGEKSSILLEGSRISAGKILNAGYKFQNPDLETALNNLLNS